MQAPRLVVQEANQFLCFRSVCSIHGEGIRGCSDCKTVTETGLPARHVLVRHDFCA